MGHELHGDRGVRRRLAALAASALLLLPVTPVRTVSAAPYPAPPAPGGPLYVGGPHFGIDAVAFTWDPAVMPIRYRVDPGPMAKSSSGAVVISNAAALARVSSMFATWTSVPTALLSTVNAGTLLASGAYTGGPVANGANALANYDAVHESCGDDQQSPVIFDPDGSLANALGLPTGLIGFAGICDGDSDSGHFRTAEIFLEGRYQDGVNTTSNHELTANQFNEAIAHEIGHLLGLDHSQINVDVLEQPPGACNAAEVAGLPLMFPVAACQDRLTLGFAALAPDDMAWVSRLYPVTTPTSAKTLTSTAYGSIRGTVFFSDGVTQVQGVNVLARNTTNPMGVAFSDVSGYLFAGNLGQSVTCGITGTSCNTNGFAAGSRDTRLVGTFDIPVTPGTYSVSVESVDAGFEAGSSVGPLIAPIAMPGTVPGPQMVTVSAGGSVTVNITLGGTAPRFDSFESAQLMAPYRPLLWQRREDFACDALG